MKLSKWMSLTSFYANLENFLIFLFIFLIGTNMSQWYCSLGSIRPNGADVNNILLSHKYEILCYPTKMKCSVMKNMLNKLATSKHNIFSLFENSITFELIDHCTKQLLFLFSCDMPQSTPCITECCIFCTRSLFFFQFFVRCI